MGKSTWLANASGLDDSQASAPQACRRLTRSHQHQTHARLAKGVTLNSLGGEVVEPSLDDRASFHVGTSTTTSGMASMSMASVFGVHGDRIALMQRRRWARKGSPNQRTTRPQPTPTSTHLVLPVVSALPVHRCAHGQLSHGMWYAARDPCRAVRFPGGIRTVMRTLAEHPPEGWTASLLASHAPTRVAMLWLHERRLARCAACR